MAKGRLSSLLRYVHDGTNWLWDSSFAAPSFQHSVMSTMSYSLPVDMLASLAFDTFTSNDKYGNLVAITGGVVHELNAYGEPEPIAVAPLEESIASGNGAGAVAFDIAGNRFFVELSMNGYAAYCLDPILLVTRNHWVFY
jgi:hypothetical protein